MKNLIMIAVLSIATLGLSAQSDLGIRTGLNFSQQSYDGVDNLETGSLTGWHFGINYEFAANETFAVRPGVLYSVRGGSTTVDDAGELIDTDNKFNYLYVPIDLVFDLTVVDIFAGPYFQYALSGTQTRGDVDVDFDFDQQDLNRTDYGLNIGLNADLNNKFYIGGYYSLGFGNLSSDDSFDIKNSSLNLFVSYRI